MLAEHERSGLSVAEFARRRGISQGSLGWWRYVARRRTAELPRKKVRATRGRAERGKFVEVRLEPEGYGGGTEVAGGAFEVVVPGGWVVRVPAHFEADTLRRLLATLGVPC